MMIDSILIVFVLFCLVVGYGLASNHVNVYGLLVVWVIGIIALQIGYFLTVVLGE